MVGRMPLQMTTRDGLFLSSELARTGLSAKALQHELAAGRLVRLRRGAYSDKEQWDGLDERQRHLLRMRAVAHSTIREPVFCDVSAAMAWGLPWLGPIGDTVHVCSAPASGGRSENDVRRHPHDLSDVRVDEREGFLVTGMALTAVELAARLPFAHGASVIDASLSRGRTDPVVAVELEHAVALLGPRAHAAAARAAVQFGSPLAGSFGESYCRAVIHELGYPAPQLQVPFSDARGFIGFVDFWWPEHRVIGEFDGAVKYQSVEMLQGLTPGEAAWREKQREDRLRRQANGFFRAIWAEVINPPRLDAVIRAAGLRPVSRARRPSRG